MAEHAEEQNPLFHYALYRAMDLLLQRLEVTGSEQDLGALKILARDVHSRLEVTHEKPAEQTETSTMQQSLLDRIEWTVLNLHGRIDILKPKPSQSSLVM